MTDGWSIRAIEIFGTPPSQASDQVWHAKVRHKNWHRGKWITVGIHLGPLCYTSRATAIAGAYSWIELFNRRGADALAYASPAEWYAPHISDPDPPEKPMTPKASQRAARRAAKFINSRTSRLKKGKLKCTSLT